MPVLINEIVFRGTIGTPGDRKPEAETTATERQMDREQLIEDTVNAVMRLLRRRGER